MTTHLLDYPYDIRGKCKKYIKPGCMDCNVDFSYIFERKYSYRTQYLPLVCKRQVYLWISNMAYESKVKVKILKLCAIWRFT